MISGDDIAGDSQQPAWVGASSRGGADRLRPTPSGGTGPATAQLHLSVDVLAPGSMKTVAKHDNQWKLQKHETHQVVERNCERVSALLMGC